MAQAPNNLNNYGNAIETTETKAKPTRLLRWQDNRIVAPSRRRGQIWSQKYGVT